MAGYARTLTATTLIALAFHAGASQRLAAQAALLGPGAAYISGGTLRIATDELNDRLAARGYPTFGRTAVTFGVGGYRILSHGVMLGFEGQGFGVGEEEHNGNEVGLGGGYATLAIGYRFELSPRVRAYPRVGIGGGGLALEIENDADSVRFDDMLAAPAPATPIRAQVLSRDGLVLDLGGGLEVTRRRGSGALIGVRLGYVLAPWESDWDYYEGFASSRDAIGGPDASISGPYIRIVVGGAWRR